MSLIRVERSEKATDPLPNLQLLRKVLDYINTHPDEWDQRAYFVFNNDKADVFGEVHIKSACIAGRAALMSDWEPINHSTVRRGDMAGRDVASVAKLELGLTTDEATGLFYGVHNFEDLVLIAKRIKERARRLLVKILHSDEVPVTPEILDCLEEVLLNDIVTVEKDS